VSLCHPLLLDAGVPHAFGTRSSGAPAGAVRPRQVHGTAVALVDRAGAEPGEADAVVATAPGVTVAVVTADCVPILLAARDGRLAAAVHAGWRGLAAGMIDSALATLAELGAQPDDLLAVVGPCVGVCCYEVDEPVLAPLRERFRAELDDALAPTGPGHARVDLGALALAELRRVLAPGSAARVEGACTCCDAERFHSYRRDGAGAGRLLHWVATGPGALAGVDTNMGRT
jgi:YfiH family protein